MKKNVDYFIYNYFFYIHKLSSNHDSNRKPNRTATLGLASLSTLNDLDQITIFSNRCYRFGLNMMLKPIQTDPRTPLVLSIKILVNTDISVIGFYGYIRNIDGYFYKNINSIKIIYIYIYI